MFRRSLLWRLAIPFILLVLVTIGGVTLYYSSYIQQIYLDNLRNNLHTQANLLAIDAAPLLVQGAPYTSLQNLAAEANLASGARITVILPDGQVVAESSTDPSGMENHSDRPEVQQALTGEEGVSIRLSNTLQSRYYYLAIPVYSGGKIVGIVRVSNSLAAVDADVYSLQRTILTNGVIVILLFIIVSFIVAELAIAPLRNLANQVAQIGNGGPPPDLHVNRKDEVGRLGLAITNIAQQLKTQIEDYREERGKLEAVLNHMTDAVLIVDSKGTVGMVNPAAERLFKIRANEALGKSMVEVVRQHQLVDLWRESTASDKQQIVTIETAPDRLFVQAIATPLDNALTGSSLLVFQDLTRVRKLETVRRDFISNVSHELRTPLASLKALTETLHEGALEDPPAARRFLTRMDNEIDNMTQLVRELLELSRIESGRAPLNRQSISPHKLINGAVERMLLQAERAGLSLTAQASEDLPMVMADAERIEQVLVNLIHNAIKFTPPSGKIEARAYQDGNRVVFAVQDTGVGIDADALSRIFERFYKADQSRSGGGTGLGLSIARHTIEAHSGRIWVESEVNQGSTFYFSLPLF